MNEEKVILTTTLTCKECGQSVEWKWLSNHPENAPVGVKHYISSSLEREQEVAHHVILCRDVTPEQELECQTCHKKFPKSNFTIFYKGGNVSYVICKICCPPFTEKIESVPAFSSRRQHGAW